MTILDPRTKRQLGDHGEANQVIEFALTVCHWEIHEFLAAWQKGNLDEWPEYYEWLERQKNVY